MSRMKNRLHTTISPELSGFLDLLETMELAVAEIDSVLAALGQKISELTEIYDDIAAQMNEPPPHQKDHSKEYF